MSPRYVLVAGVVLLSLTMGILAQAQQATSPSGAPLLAKALHAIQAGRSQDALTPLRQLSSPPLFDELSPLWQRRLPFLIGYLYAQSGDFSKAMLYLERAREQYPELQDYTLWYLGDGLLRLDRAEGARTALQWLVDAFPDSLHRPEALFRLAEAHRHLGDLSGAANLYTQYRRAFPDGARRDEASLHLGVVHRDLGNPQAALREWRQLWIQHPESAAAAQVPELERTLPQAYSPAAPTADELYQRAERLYRLNRHREALLAFELARAVAPDRVIADDLLNRIGTCQYQARENRAALETFQHLFERAPQGPLAATALLMQARLYLRMERDEDFLAATQTLLARFPKSKQADELGYLLGHFYRNRGLVGDALQAFQRVADLGKGSAYADAAWWYLGWVHYRTGHDERAILAWARVLGGFQASPLIPDALYWQARAYERLGRPEEARARLQRLAASYAQTYYGHLAQARLRGRAVWPWNAAPQPAGFAPLPPPPSLPAALSIDHSSPYAMRANELWGMRLFLEAGEELTAIPAWGPIHLTVQAHAAQAFHAAGEHHRAMGILRSHPKAPEAGIGHLPPAEVQEMTYPLGGLRRLDHTSLDGLDPLFVGALVMAESNWNPHALSRVGARGLMQLMPDTGRRVAQALGIDLLSDDQLFDASLNLRLGSAHLADLLQRFDGSLPLSFASYNAGEDTVRKWWDRRGDSDIEEFIADIPYRETRRYVQRIFEYYTEYQRIYRTSRP